MTTVTTKDYCNAYNDKTKIRIIELKSKVKTFTKIKKLVVTTIEYNNKSLKQYFGVEVKDVIDAVVCNLSSLESKIPFYILPLDGLSKPELLVEVEKLAGLNKKLDNLNNQITKEETNLISYKLYKFIISTFNKELVNEIIKGYEFNAGYGISTIRIQKKKRDLTRDVINWGASLKRKREIIAEGKVPYAVIERDAQRLITKDNGGVPYFIYMVDDYSYWWYWNKKNSNLPNELVYSFSPVKGKGCIIKKLHKYREDNPQVTLNYRM